MLSSEPTLWDEVLGTWDLEKIPFPSKLALEIGKVFEGVLPKGASLLEAGSGSGELSAYLASIGYTVALLDFSDVALSLSKGLFRKHELPGSFQKGDLFNLPFADGSFDCVWNSGVLEHYRDQEIVEALREMARVSKGLVITFVPNAGAIFYRLGKWDMERRGKWPFGEEYPKTSMKKLFAEAGLRCVREDYLAVDMGIEWLRNTEGIPNELVDLLHEWEKSLIDRQAIRSGLAYLVLTIGIKGEDSAVVKKKNHAIEQLAEAVSALQDQLAETKRLLVTTHQQKDERIRYLQARLSEREQALEAIYRSKHWKLMGIYWQAIGGGKRFVRTLLSLFRSFARRVLPYEWRLRIVRMLRRVRVLRPATPASLAAFRVAGEVPPRAESPWTAPTKYDVICFPIIDWEFRFQRPQQLMTQFAHHRHHVFYLWKN